MYDAHLITFIDIIGFLGLVAKRTPEYVERL